MEKMEYWNHSESKANRMPHERDCDCGLWERVTREYWKDGTFSKAKPYKWIVW